MNIIDQGKGTLFTDPDSDKARGLSEEKKADGQ